MRDWKGRIKDISRLPMSRSLGVSSSTLKMASTVGGKRIAGWYSSGITIGLESKPIRIGARIDLATFKLQCRVLGGKGDEGLKDRHENTFNMQKWVNLSDIMLDSFKHNAQEEWSMNMMGTCQSNRSGGWLHSAADNEKLKVGAYECAMYQHNSLPLSPELLPAGMGVNWRKRVDGVREYESTPVQFPLRHQRDYSLTIHLLIDKGNGKGSKYDRVAKQKAISGLRS
eukprot:scaffold10154_cov63-Cyclotella_meneghiniana.AAC.21